MNHKQGNQLIGKALKMAMATPADNNRSAADEKKLVNGVIEMLAEMGSLMDMMRGYLPSDLAHTGAELGDRARIQLGKGYSSQNDFLAEDLSRIEERLQKMAYTLVNTYLAIDQLLINKNGR